MKLMRLFGIASLAFMISGCALFSGSKLDKDATRQNDENVQVITTQNDDLNKKLGVADSLRKSREARNKAARKLARSMARDAGNDDLPEDSELDS